MTEYVKKCEYEKNCLGRQRLNYLINETKGTDFEKNVLSAQGNLDHLCGNYKTSCPIYQLKNSKDNEKFTKKFVDEFDLIDLMGFTYEKINDY